jgi:hypothetical protein
VNTAPSDPLVQPEGHDRDMARLACTLVIRGELDDRFSGTFNTLTLTRSDGLSRLSGTVADQAELQGLLRQLYGLGLEIVSFTSGDRTDSTDEPPNHPGERPTG